MGLDAPQPARDAAAHALGPERSFTFAQIGAKDPAVWRLGFHDEGLTLEGPEGDREPFSRDQVIQRFDALPIGKLTLLRLNERKQVLRLDEDGSSMLRSWALPMLRRWGDASTQRQFKPRLVTGIVFTLLSAMMWWTADTESVLVALFGLGSLVAGIGARARPGRWLYAWSGVYLAAIGLAATAEIAMGVRHWGWLAAPIVLGFMAVGSYRRFAFFAPDN
jgi:hypothetical protein